MPSVKSYQNRKHEIEVLKNTVKDWQFQAKGFSDNVQALRKELQVQKCQFELMSVNYERMLKTQSENFNRQIEGYKMADGINSDIMDALRKTIDELERRIRIYRQYIRYGEAYYPEHTTTTVQRIG